MITIGYIIIVLGFINMMRMLLFTVGGDIYDIKKARKDNAYKKTLLNQNRINYSRKKLIEKIMLRLIGMMRFLIFRITGEFYEINLKKITQRDRAISRYRPSVSVVVPAYNEQKVILKCIESVINSKYSNFELIVVDDGSADDTYKIVKDYKKLHKLKKLHVIKQANKGKAAALNNAIKNRAKGTLIMCLDADSLISPDAIKNAVKYFKDKRVQALASNVIIIDDGSILGLLQKFEYLISYRMKKSLTVFNIEYIVGGVGSMFRKSTLKKLNYYDTNTITEDIDLSMKIVNKGNIENRVIYASDVLTFTQSVPSIRDLIKQRFRWKYGRMQTFLKYKSMFYNNSKIHNKGLTWLYLPNAIFSELAFSLEPIFLSFFLIATLFYGDTSAFSIAYFVITLYISLMVMADENTKIWDKVHMVVLAPAVYILFLVMSFVEYSALLKSIAKLPNLKSSLLTRHASWTHVKRTG